MKKVLDPDARLFAALGDPTRLAILRQLASDGTVCACDFTACCDVGQSTVSHHLRVLREAGLIRGERRGTWIHYSLAPAAIARMAVLLAGLRGASMDRTVAPGSLGRALPVVASS